MPNPRTFRPARDVDHNGNTNEMRADRAEMALLTYKREAGYPDTDCNEDVLTDLLCDLMHLADREEMEFDDRLDSAHGLHGDER